MKNKTGLVVVIALIIIAVLGGTGIFTKLQEPPKPTKIPEFDQITSYDFEKNYPDSPAAVIELNNKIMSFLYGGMITEEQIPDIIKKQRNLFALELLNLNSAELQVEAAKQQIALIQAASQKIIKIEAQAPVYDLEDKTKCSVIVTQYTSTTVSNFVKYHLINEDGLYKILTWEAIDPNGGTNNANS